MCTAGFARTEETVHARRANQSGSLWKTTVEELPFIFSVVVLITDKHTKTKRMQWICAFTHYVTMTVFLFQILDKGENAEPRASGEYEFSSQF